MKTYRIKQIWQSLTFAERFLIVHLMKWISPEEIARLLDKPKIGRVAIGHIVLAIQEGKLSTGKEMGISQRIARQTQATPIKTADKTPVIDGYTSQPEIVGQGVQVVGKKSKGYILKRDESTELVLDDVRDVLRVKQTKGPPSHCVTTIKSR